MSFIWPPHLIERIADNHWVLFLGSGVSSSAVNEAGDGPPGWSDLLTRLAARIPDVDQGAIADELIASLDYLGAADHIRWACSEGAGAHAYREELRLAVEGPALDRFKPSALHTALLELEPTIVVTTNYDKLFETASQNGFISHDFRSTSLGDDLRSAVPVLVKVHGSVDDIDGAILTRRDFVRVGQEGRAVLDAIRALALTSTFLFVGYSLEDPDIQLLLQGIGRGSLSPEAHFMLTEEALTRSSPEVFKESYGISMLEYSRGQHLEAQEAIEALAEAVISQRAIWDGDYPEG